MALRNILLYPDPRLKRRADAVEAFDDDLRRLVADMYETMYDAPGIGLAAPQIGVMRRLVVMDCAGRDEDDPSIPPDPLTMVNPEIVWSSEERAVEREGCLSLPEHFAEVERPAEVRVRFHDVDGAEQERTFSGIRAACAQHEVDHLNGKLFIDYIGPVKRSMIVAKMKKLKRERAKERAGAR